MFRSVGLVSRWLNLYEGVIAAALKTGSGTKGLTVNLIDQGVNGGTVTDLVRGWSPWGHLDPHEPQSNITFAQTIARDKPDVVAIEIGVNDVWQQPARGENSSVYAQVGGWVVVRYEVYLVLGYHVCMLYHARERRAGVLKQ